MAELEIEDLENLLSELKLRKKHKIREITNLDTEIGYLKIKIAEKQQFLLKSKCYV